MTRWLIAACVLVLFAVLSTAAPVPKALKKAKPVRAKIEPLPGDKLYWVDWKDVPCRQVAEELEQRTGLMFLSKDIPDVKITLKAEQVCAKELFAQLCDILHPQGWMFWPNRQSFSIYSTEFRVNRKSTPTIKLDQLGQHFPYAPAQLILDVDDKGAEAGKKVLKGIDDDFMEVTTFGHDALLVTGLGKSLQQFVTEMGDHIKK